MSNKGTVLEIIHKTAEQQLTGKPHTCFRAERHALQTCSTEAFRKSHNSNLIIIESNMEFVTLPNVNRMRINNGVFRIHTDSDSSF